MDWADPGRSSFQDPRSDAAVIFWTESDLEEDDELPDWVTLPPEDNEPPDSDIAGTERKIFLESFCVGPEKGLSAFWIRLTVDDLKPRWLHCFVRGPTGVRYPVLVTKDPQLEYPHQLRCIWRPVESGSHKAVAFLGDKHVPGSPCTFLVEMEVSETTEKSDIGLLSPHTKRILPRRLVF